MIFYDFVPPNKIIQQGKQKKKIKKFRKNFSSMLLIVFLFVQAFLPVQIFFDPPRIEIQEASATDYYNDYSDVLIVINDNSAASVEIGAYFQTERNIPESHVVHLNCLTNETVNRAEFNSNINEPIRNFLTSNGIANDINYIVTTKGVPLRVSGTGNASVDSELTLVLGGGTQGGSWWNEAPCPYYGDDEIFSREKFGIYLVTRLTGYTIAEAKSLVDLSTAATNSGIFVFDVDPGKDGGGYQIANDWMRDAASILTTAGKTVVLDETTTYLTEQSNVLGYTSWGSNDGNDLNNGKPNNNWAPGALAETFVSTSARSFTTGTAYGQSLIADLITEGITGVSGHVYEPYLSATIQPNILFERYVSGYNLADSYYMSIPYLSWMTVVVGDPKTKINTMSSTLAISLNSPLDGATFKQGEIIDLSISGNGFDEAWYTLNGGGNIALTSPFDIDTTGWNEGNWTLVVHAHNTFGNIAEKTYQFKVWEVVGEIPIYTYFDNADTTDFKILPNYETVTDAVLSVYDIGKIDFSGQTLNFSGLDLDSNITIANNFISLNSVELPTLDTSAILTIYHAINPNTGLAYEHPIILKDGVVCADCAITSHTDTTTVFTVTGFSGYSLGTNSQITVYDDTDTLTKYQDEEVNFFANFTDLSSNPITTATCTISFPDASNGNMVYNSDTQLYEYAKSFSEAGSSLYEIVCSDDSYETINAEDDFVITATPWYGITGWDYRQKITIDKDKVGANLIDFPVLIQITDQANTLFNNAQADGDDILFVDDNNVKLKHEIEYYQNSGDKELTAWVKIPSLSSSEDTIIYLYYGNDSCVDQSDKNNVWDDDYRMVQHLKETAKTSGVYNDHFDSTSNLNNGEAENGVVMTAVGKIDGGDDFDGDNDYIGVEDDDSLDITDAITIEAWVKKIPTDGYGTPVGTPITTCTELQNMKNDLTADYYLANDIDCSATSGWNGGAGFEPIGNGDNQFTGIFDGQGYKITDLYINRPSTNFVGLFGFTYGGGRIKNVGLENVDISGGSKVGSLVGYDFCSSITNSYSTGSVSGNGNVGGLVGAVDNLPITNSYSTCNVSGVDEVGGLVGLFESGASITNSYSTGSVSGNGKVGGLVGDCSNGASITNSYSTGSVSGNSQVGGVVGAVSGASITKSYSTGSVSGSSSVGGLVGRSDEGTITNSYSTGSVGGTSDVGGLLGGGYYEGIITNSYSTGTVSGSSNVGGLIGGTYDGGVTTTNSYWDTQTSEQATSDGGTGKTTTQMKQQATFIDWDFTDIWGIEETITYPFFDLETEREDIINKETDAYSLRTNNDGSMLYGYISDNKITAIFSNPTDWHYHTMTFDGTDQKLYIDGVLEKTTSPCGAIGVNLDDLTIGGINGYFNGTIDEVRISSTARSVDWFLASYNNQNLPGDFYALGSEEILNTSPSSPTSLIQLKNNGTTVIVNQGLTNETVVKLKASVIDNDNPEIITLFFETALSGGNFISPATPTVEGSCSSETVWGDCSNKIWYSTSSEGDYSTTPFTGTTTVAGLSDATGYKWQVKACDDDSVCGDWVAYNATVPNFTIDTAAPFATFSANAPLNPTNQNSTDITIAGTDVTHYKYKLDEGTYCEETAITTHLILSELSDGEHTIYLIGRDIAGNYQTTATEHTWTIDITSPIISLSSPVNNSSTSDKKPTLTWSGTDVTSGIAKYQLYIDNNLDTDNITNTSITLANNLSCGAHTWFVKAIDNADNPTNSSTFNLFISCGSVPVYILQIMSEQRKQDEQEAKIEQEVDEQETIATQEPITETSVEIVVKQIKQKIAEILDKIIILKDQLQQLSNKEISEIPCDNKFNNNLKYNDKGDEIKYLQIFLKSQGNEIYPEAIVSGWFGPLTKKAIIRFQEKYASDILSPYKLIKGTGFVGNTTRAKINELLNY